MLGIHHEEGQVWLRWLFPRVSPRYISVDTHTFVNQAFSIAVYPHDNTTDMDTGDPLTTIVNTVLEEHHHSTL